MSVIQKLFPPTVLNTRTIEAAITRYATGWKLTVSGTVNSCPGESHLWRSDPEQWQGGIVTQCTLLVINWVQAGPISTRKMWPDASLYSPLTQRHTDTVRPWHTDTMRHWHSGTVRPWHTDTVRHWHSETVTHWHSETVTPWHTEIMTLSHSDTLRLWLCRTVTLRPWLCHTVTHWDRDSVVQWHTETVTLSHSDTLPLWRHDAVTHWHPGTVISWHTDTVRLWRCHTVTHWHTETVTQRHTETVTLSHSDTLTLWRRDTLLWHSGTILWLFPITAWPFALWLSAGLVRFSCYYFLSRCSVSDCHDYHKYLLRLSLANVSSEPLDCDNVIVFLDTRFAALSSGISLVSTRTSFVKLTLWS